MKSLGFVEVSGVTAAIDALDIMCKSADVTLVSWERKLGGRLVTLIVSGTVSAVTAAVDSAKAGCIKKPCATAVIANPHPETVRLCELSAARLKKKAEAEKQAEAKAKAEAAPAVEEKPQAEAKPASPAAKKTAPKTQKKK